MHRSGLPKAIKETLNKTALDVKKKTMLTSSRKEFENRTNSRFFRGNSKVFFAKGFNVDKLAATVGFLSINLRGSNNKSVDDLEAQEEGGLIGGRSFIPLKQARISKNFKRVTRKKFRISDIKSKIIDTKKTKGSNNKEKWTRAAVFADKGGFVIGTNRTSAGNRILFGIRKVGRSDGRTFVSAVPLFAVKKNRKVSVKASHFMRNAANKSSRKMEGFFIDESKKVIARLKKR